MCNIRLYNGDCLEVMNSLIQKGVKVDAVITDPPYGTTTCKWDNVIPFEPMWNCLHKLIKENGAIVLFGSEPFSSSLRMSNLKEYRYDWVWKKNKASNFLFSNKQPLKCIELVSVFYKRQPTYNPQKIINPKGKSKRHLGKMCDTNKISLDLMNNRPKMKYSKNYEPDKLLPKQIIEFNVENKKLHPTQKPIDLCEYLIKTYTNEGDIILDFTMGSGSTGVACKKLNRNFIGIELDEHYFKIAKERIENV